MPNPDNNVNEQELTKEERLTNELVRRLYQSNANTAGNLAALLGNMAAVKGPLSKVAHDALVQFYIPTREIQRGNNPEDKVTVLEIDNLKRNMNKIGMFRYITLIEPTYQKRMDTNDVYSDQYFGNQLAQDPKISAISTGLTSAQLGIQMQEQKELIGDKSELVGIYLNEGQDMQYDTTFKKIVAEEKFKNLTKEELDAWKKEWEDYYRKQNHEEFVAEILWETALSEEEHKYWSKCFNYGEDKRQWIKHWMSLKPYREEFEAEHKDWLTKKLTAEEWALIKGKYHVPVHDLNHAVVDIDLDDPEQDLANAEWEKNKEEYRRRYWNEVLAPKWIGDWEKTHGQPWHPEPVLTERQKSDEEEAFNDDFYNADNAPKYYWMDYMKKSVLRMNDFFGLGGPLEDDRSKEYLKEQEFLKKLEAERDKQQKEVLTKEQFLAQQDAATLESQKAIFEQVYRLFTEGDFSFLDTEQYLAMKKAAREAAANYVNTPGTPKKARWYPEDKANDAVCKLMPLFDSIEDRMYNLSYDGEGNNDFMKLMRQTRLIQKELKQGTSERNLAYLMDSLFECDVACTQYMQDHRRPSIFHWNAFWRYYTVKKLHKGIVKGLTAVKDAFEKEGLKNSQAEYNKKVQLDADRTAVQAAKQQIQNNKMHDKQAYENAQNQIRDGLKVVNELQAKRRNSLPAGAKAPQPEAAPQNGRKSVNAPTAPQMQNGKR